MFDTISRPRPRRPAAGNAVSFAIHALAITIAVWFGARRIQVATETAEPIVRLIPGPKGAAPSGPRGPIAPPERRKRPPRPSMMQPTVTPAPAAVEPPVEAEVERHADSSGDLSGAGGVIGVPTGSSDGVSDGFGRASDGSVNPGPQLFDEGRMTAPQRLSGPDPAYTVQALEHEVEGSMTVRCIVTEQGVVYGCRVIKSLPYMDSTVIRALEQRRYAPARIGGQAVAVDYLFQIRLRLPAQ